MKDPCIKVEAIHILILINVFNKKPVRFCIFTQSEIPSGTTEFMQRVVG